MPTLLLIHGGLWEDIGADWFWRRPGVVGGLERLGFTVVAPDRLRRPPSWTADADHVRAAIPQAAEPLTVVGGSFGCSVAVRLALDSPDLVARIVLAWPAALSDQFTTIRFRAGLARLGAPARVLNTLLGTGTLPSATDAELGALSVPAGVIPAVPPDPSHSRGTVDALLRVLTSAAELPGCPEAPRPEFPPHLESFLASVAGFADSPA
jgi:pimeloyl-ACP methyl ester carboxylesterase